MAKKEGRELQLLEVAVLGPQGSSFILSKEQSGTSQVSNFIMYNISWRSSQETKIKGYINILGYKVIVDENVNPGRYGFRIVHDHDRTHLFSSDEQLVVREWMKSLMKATIGRDYTRKS
jgi:hypothetical protein